MINLYNNPTYVAFITMMEQRITLDKDASFKIFDAFCNWLTEAMDAAIDIKTAFRILSRIKTKLHTLKDEILETAIVTTTATSSYSFLFDCAIMLIDTEEKILEHRMEHPKLFQNRRVYVEDMILSAKYTQADLMELIASLDAIAMFTDSKGRAIPFNTFTETMGRLCSVQFVDCYKKRDEILARKTKLTSLLDKMKEAMVDKSQL